MATDGGSIPESALSQHPVDVLIRDLIRSRRATTPDEIARIVERMATVPFDERIVPIPEKYRGLSYQGRTLATRDSVLFLHLVQRIVVEEQWADGTDADAYLADLRAAVRDPGASLCLYHRRGGAVAETVGITSLPLGHRGAGSLPYIFVAYSVDRGRIISGYQASGKHMLSIPEDALWLR